MDFDLKITREPKVKNPVLIEGLPGIGHVGRLAARHLVIELRAKKFGILHSDHFPPQVLIGENGIIQTMKNEFYYWKAEKKNQKDLILVIGNTQSASSEGQYMLSKQILDVAGKYSPESIFTLGGLGIGKVVEKPKVFGAVTHKKFIPELERLGVTVSRDGMGQIIGVSGLLLAMARLRGLDGACLMGETSGFYIDPNSAKAVLKVLCGLLNVEVDMKNLTKKARVAKKRVAEAQRMEKKMMEDLGMIHREPSAEEMRYIG
ncbi:MAG: proteasome assembly chaperone family protein [Candidatus Hydrothermarchaeales archaeon]